MFYYGLSLKKCYLIYWPDCVNSLADDEYFFLPVEGRKEGEE